MSRLGQPQLFNSINSICNKYFRALVSKIGLMTENSQVVQNQPLKRSTEDEAEADVKKSKTDTYVRIKKRNFAMMMGYLGKNYYGMQRNPGMDTIEEDLFKAMLKADLIDSKSFEVMQSIHFQRAARTDKGVSAVRQVVSLKLPENPCKDRINMYLPEDIKIFAIKRVTKGFNSKAQCDARTYSYTMPTFAFAPEDLEEFRKLTDFHDLDKRQQQLSIIDGKPYQEYRLPKDTFQRLNAFLQTYEGTHNFHNFTSKILPLDPRAKRFIMSFVAEEPFIVDNMEYITLKVKGQSFMMHQIRKMVGMAIGFCRNIVTKEEYDLAFEPQKYDISRAPCLGLMLNIVHYDYYNKKYGSDGLHEKLDWTECEEEIKEFEKNKILKHVFDTEKNENSMLSWLANVGPNSFGLHDESKDEAKDEGKEENDD